MLCGEVHREADEEWQGSTPETDVGELEGEESGPRGEGKRTQRVDSKGSGECDRKAAHRVDRGGISDNYEVDKKQHCRWFQADDDDERCKRREKPEETALRRQTRKGRTREGGTQGGRTPDPPDD